MNKICNLRENKGDMQTKQSFYRYHWFTSIADTISPEIIKLHGLAESKIIVLGFILAYRVKWLNGTLETILSCTFIMSTRKLRLKEDK